MPEERQYLDASVAERGSLIRIERYVEARECACDSWLIGCGWGRY